jgi:hypothetical protein
MKYLQSGSAYILYTCLAASVACAAPATAGCDDDAARPPPLEVVTTAALEPRLHDFVALLPYPDAILRVADDPVADVAAAAAAAGPEDHRMRVAVVEGEDGCKECFRLERGSGAGGADFIVRGDAPLGVQYGLAQLLEHAGVRFYHPYATHAPATLAVPAGEPGFGTLVTPALALRGLHLHTIHPIEAYWAFWEPSAAHVEDARRILDWLVKNRGNYVQWVALDNIQDDPVQFTAWKTHTRTLIDLAHARGLGAGVGIQLFGLSNVQRGWDLIDEPLVNQPASAQIEARLPAMLDGLPWDRVNLSFGEFFSAPPEDFVASVNAAYDALQAHAPGTEMAATIHLGNSPDQRVDYMGENLQYYFLVKFANAAIVPWVHTVMYFNLFDDAGGAYGHVQFDEHRAYLLERVGAGQRAAYFPESAYWVAFDDSVPLYLPVYMVSRARDLAQIDAQAVGGGKLAEHVLFSSGWEWGYWQNDYATLRMTYDGGADASATLAAMWAPYGAPGAELAAALAALGGEQRQRLIVEHLAPYLAGRDVYIDTGFELGVVAQPDRPSFAQVAAYDAATRASFETDVLARLEALASATDATLASIRALDLPAGDPFVAEIEDGLEIDVARAHAIVACYRAALAFGASGAGTAELADAEAAVAAGHVIVARRHAALHDPNHAEIAEQNVNSTIYAFGYLQKADTLCYWERELVQLRNLLGINQDTPPACVM